MWAIFTPPAERHIDKLHDYITKDACASRADGYISRSIACCHGFIAFPMRGTRHNDVPPGLCVTGFESRGAIAFVVTAEAVLIEGIFYGKSGMGQRSATHQSSRSAPKKSVVQLKVLSAATWI